MGGRKGLCEPRRLSSFWPCASPEIALLVEIQAMLATQIAVYFAIARLKRPAYSLISRSFITFNTSTVRALLSRMTPIARSFERLRETVSIVMPR